MRLRIAHRAGPSLKHNRFKGAYPSLAYTQPSLLHVAAAPRRPRTHYADQSARGARAPRRVLYNALAHEYITRQNWKGVFLQTYLVFVIVKLPEPASTGVQ